MIRAYWPLHVAFSCAGGYLMAHGEQILALAVLVGCLASFFLALWVADELNVTPEAE